ncbi:hypothetical protein ZWY2020_040346 [Hordeum vulgare]|nr:hypothetical protein ZWY2020_040346 [Hordeum vulgare]
MVPSRRPASHHRYPDLVWSTQIHTFHRSQPLPHDLLAVPPSMLRATTAMVSSHAGARGSSACRGCLNARVYRTAVVGHRPARGPACSASPALPSRGPALLRIRPIP